MSPILPKTYLITGASSGIGNALCCNLAQNGQKVIAVARRKDRLEKLQAAFSHNISIISADLSTEQGRQQVINEVGETVIAGLVNNAGITGQVDFLEHLSIENWHQLCSINLDAPMFLIQGLLARFQQGSRIINLTTGTTNFVLSGVAGYSMTKAALNTFTKYLSEELKTKGIFVTAAHPGIVETELANDARNHPNQQLGIVQANKKLKAENKYLDVEIAAKFLCWLLLKADSSLYTGDIIGVYNQKYQPLWHGETIASPYPAHIAPP